MAAVLAFSVAGRPAFVPSSPAPEAASRRSAVLFWGGAAATVASVAPPALARTKEEETELCLSTCVYECSGGARGKGEEFKDRKKCIKGCRDKCTPKEAEEEVFVLN